VHYEVHVAEWGQYETRLSALRFEVFVREQGVPVELELDEDDPLAIHVASSANGEVVGTGRILSNGKIGRMAVKASFRGNGIGSAILMRLVAEGRRLRLCRVYLGAQLSAITFYEAHGFAAYGDVFPDAGIDHQMMELLLD
jgi:predicted GNAT family N-acyltransferase